MTTLSGPFPDALFVVSAVMIWFIIAYQFVLFVAGLFYRGAGRVGPIADPIAWPAVPILVPAPHEARVILPTLEALLALDYPPDPLEIAIVDGGSHAAT